MSLKLLLRKIIGILTNVGKRGPTGNSKQVKKRGGSTDKPNIEEETEFFLEIFEPGFNFLIFPLTSVTHINKYVFPSVLRAPINWPSVSSD